MFILVSSEIHIAVNNTALISEMGLHSFVRSFPQRSPAPNCSRRPHFLSDLFALKVDYYERKNDQEC